MPKFILVLLSLLLGLTLCTCDPAQNSQGVMDSGSAVVSSSTRSMLSLNTGWTYHETFATTPDAAMETTGSPTSLPHTWNQWDAVDMLPGYRRSAGWYIRDLRVSTNAAERQILYFEGANTKAEVFLNGEKIGGHIGGYVGFEVDLTDHLTSGTNQLAVRVTNEYDRDLIPSQKSDFFIYGGLTRDVWLKTVPATYLTQLKVSTPEVNTTSATTKLEVNLIGRDQLDGNAGLTAEIVSPSGETVSQANTEIASGTKTVTLDFPAISTPQLWSPDAPNRYELRLRLTTGEEVMDELTQKFGYRFYSFTPNGPFLLNGERLLLRGTHRHEEHAGYGAAMPDSLHRRDIEQMKEMGVNFLRLGHYPQDPTIYETCDELGIIVWDELPWCRGGKKRELNVFSNCDEVELMHNGKTLGRKTRELGKYPAQGLSWNLLFEEGNNNFISKGFKDGKQVAEDTLTVTYTYTKHGVAKNIVLTHRPLDNGNTLIVATMRDKDGLRVLDYEDNVYFDLNGAGKLLKNYGTPTRSQIIQMANGRAAIEMVPGKGKTVIEARNQDFKGSYLEIE